MNSPVSPGPNDIAAGLVPVLTQFGAALREMMDQTLSSSKLGKKRAKGGGDSSDEEELTGDQKLERLLKFGGTVLSKKGKTIEEFQRESECDKIRAAQRIRKVNPSAPTKWDLMWNQGIDEQTRFLVQLEVIAHEKEHPDVSETALARCKVYEHTVYTQLQGLNEKMDVIWDCMDLVKGGRLAEAEAEYSLFLAEMAEKKDSKLVTRLRAEARAKVKQDKELLLLEAVALMATGGNNSVSAAPVPQWMNLDQGAHKGGKGGGRGSKGGVKGGGKGGGPNGFVMRWVDGALFDASLAGVQCLHPDTFPGFFLARLDSESNGKVHWAGWQGTCGACQQVGHSHSECEPKRWKVGTQEFANVRWLYQNGFCDATGKKK